MKFNLNISINLNDHYSQLGTICRKGSVFISGNIFKHNILLNYMNLRRKVIGNDDLIEQQRILDKSVNDWYSIEMISLVTHCVEYIQSTCRRNRLQWAFAYLLPPNRSSPINLHFSNLKMVECTKNFLWLCQNSRGGFRLLFFITKIRLITILTTLDDWSEFHPLLLSQWTDWCCYNYFSNFVVDRSAIGAWQSSAAFER